MFNRASAVKDFFGRSKQQKILLDRARSFKDGFRHNIAILAEPLMGKTSLVQDFISNLSEKDIVAFSVEVGREPFSSFTRRYMGCLLYRHLVSKGQKPKSDVKWLIRHCKKGMPQTIGTVARIEKLLLKGDYNQAYGLLLDLTDLFFNETGNKCIVIIESFDNLSYYALSEPYEVLGKKIMAQPNTLYYVTSRSPQRAKRILNENLRLLFGNFELLELKAFDFAASRDFLTRRVNPFALSDRLARFLIYFTDGHPFYLDIISDKIKEVMAASRRKQASAALLNRALDELLVNPLGALYMHFSGAMERIYAGAANGIDCASVLLSLCEGNNKKKQLLSDLGAPNKNLSRFLSNLRDDGVVAKVGSFHRIPDALFKFWLKGIYARQRQQFTADPRAIANSFRLELRKISASFKAWSKEDLYDKVVDLFKSFKGELVELDGKGVIAPCFSEVAPRVIGQSGPYIIGHARGKNWICQIRDRDVNERHVSDFVEDTKKSKYKFHRKVLIVLGDIDVNARLLAKESGIWIWNLKALNLLLDIYGMPKVIHW